MTIDEALAHEGEAVVYRAGTDLAEDGVITSVGVNYIMVRYAGDEHAKVTYPRDLTLKSVVLAAYAAPAAIRAKDWPAVDGLMTILTGTDEVGSSG